MALRIPTSSHERKQVVVFDPAEQKKKSLPGIIGSRKRVAAYARVSTEQDAQQNSYEAQISFYTDYIKSKPEWEFVEVYSDEGISGTSYKNRDGFNRMVNDALAGKIDMILTKSISRFARNTVDSLTVTRKLKAAGVEVFFEKENISSMDAQAELIFTIMSSCAQEESRSLSENVRWGHQRSMEAGKISVAWSTFLGYEKGLDGLPRIVEEEAAIVRRIPATISRTTSEPIASSAKRKVAAYARVSTDLEEQQTSYEAQVSYYTDYIKSREDWDFVKVYTDEGVTGTSTKYREGFQEMVGDALSGKIDLIVTKSVSRFARNTVDSLTTIRELKEHGTEVYFEKENIWTFDSKGELLLTIMSSLAQEESRSISENVRWGQRKKAADGKYTLAYAHFLGYDKGEDGKPVINTDQAVIVQEIYTRFLEGYSFNRIAGMLTERGIPSPAGKTQWNDCTIKSILTNEIYMGDKLLQKSFTLDFLHKKPIKNEGQVPQYYVENDHEAIIPETMFRRVQDEIKRREGGAPHGISIFSGKLSCGACGNPYGPKLWHSKDEYRRTVWQCNAKYKKKLHCRTPHLTEDEIKEAFIQACRKLVADREEILTHLREDVKYLEDTTALVEKAESLTDECARIAERLQALIDKNARVAQDQKTYLEQYDELADTYKRTDKKLKAVTEEIRMKESRGRRIREFIAEFERMPSDITEFDADQWATFVDQVTVYRKDDIRFTLAYGAEIRA